MANESWNFTQSLSDSLCFLAVNFLIYPSKKKKGKKNITKFIIIRILVYIYSNFPIRVLISIDRSQKCDKYSRNETLPRNLSLRCSARRSDFNAWIATKQRTERFSIDSSLRGQPRVTILAVAFLRGKGSCFRLFIVLSHDRVAIHEFS